MTIALGPVRPGKIVMGGALGVLASTLATEGLHGPAYPVGALSLPADAGLEISAWITRWPTNGVLTLYGDTGEFSYSGADDYFLWELRVANQLVADDIGYGPGISRVNLFFADSSGTIFGNVLLDAVAPGGNAAGGGGGAALSGDAPLDTILVAGDLSGGNASALGGDITLDPAQADGALQGDLTNWVPPMTDGMRLFRPGRTTPRWLAPLDVEEVDNLICDFSTATSLTDPIVSAAWTCEARVGNDPNAQPVLFGAWQLQGLKVRQRIKGELGVVGVTYLIRVEGTTESGRVIPAAAFMRVVRQA